MREKNIIQRHLWAQSQCSLQFGKIENSNFIYYPLRLIGVCSGFGSSNNGPVMTSVFGLMSECILFWNKADCIWICYWFLWIWSFWSMWMNWFLDASLCSLNVRCRVFEDIGTLVLIVVFLDVAGVDRPTDIRPFAVLARITTATYDIDPICDTTEPLLDWYHGNSMWALNDVVYEARYWSHHNMNCCVYVVRASGTRSLVSCSSMFADLNGFFITIIGMLMNVES